MKRITLLSVFLLSFSFLFAQYPAKQTIGNDSTLIQPKGAIKGRIINWSYPDTASANRERISHYPGAQITVGDLVYFRNSDGTRWILLGSNSTALNTGLTSTGNITLVDSTLTIGDTIRYTINGTNYVQTTPSVFTINSADSGYYRKDLIYADATGLHKLVGTPDTAFGVSPKLPKNTIPITTVDVYGKQIIPPIPTIITPIPNLQQVTDQGNSTTNPIFINSNNIQTPLRITADRNRSNYLYFKNNSNGGWANTGFLFKNDVPDDPNNEHTGHFLQVYMGSTNSAFSKDGGLIRSNGTGGIKVALDSGKFVLGTGSPSTGNYTSRFEMGTNGDLSFLNYKNNATLDSVLATDQNGKVIMRKVSVGDIDVLQAPDSAYGDIKKLDGTHKYIVILADGTIGGSNGGSIDTISLSQRINNKWDLNGNVISTTNFIGSTNNADLIFKTFNQLSGYIGESSTQHNTSYGRKSLPYNTINLNDNSSFGYFNMGKTTGNGNNSMGAYGMFNNVDGTDNNVFGVAGLFLSVNTKGNGVLGNNGLYSLTGGGWNLALGDSTFRNVTNAKFLIGLGNKVKWDSTSLQDRTLYISDSTIHAYMQLDSAVGTAPSVVGKDANGFWHVYQTPTGGGSTYTLPIASATILGGIKVGSGLAIDGSGVLSATGGVTYTASNGLTMVGSNVQLGGILSSNSIITTNSNNFTLNGSVNNYTGVLNVNNNSSGYAIRASGSGNNIPTIYGTSSGVQSTAIAGTASGHGSDGVFGGSYDEYGGKFNSFIGVPLYAYRDSGTFSIDPVVQLVKTIHHPNQYYATNGMGQSIQFLQSDTNRVTGYNMPILNSIVSSWQDTLTGKSLFYIEGLANRTTTNRLFSLSGDGRTTLSKYGSGTFTGVPAYSLGVDASGNIIELNTIQLKGYTVATLPSGVQGMTAYVTDASSPAFLATVVGGGSTVVKVFYNGTNWIVQ